MSGEVGRAASRDTMLRRSGTGLRQLHRVRPTMLGLALNNGRAHMAAALAGWATELFHML